MEFAWVKQKVVSVKMFWPGKIIPEESKFTAGMKEAYNQCKSPSKAFVRIRNKASYTIQLIANKTKNDLIHYDEDQKQTERLIHKGIATLETLKDSDSLLERFRNDILEIEVLLLNRVKNPTTCVKKRDWLDKIKILFDSTKMSNVANPVDTSETVVTSTSTSIIKTGGSQRIKRSDVKRKQNTENDDNEKNKKKRSKLQHNCHCGFSTGSSSELVSHATSSHSPKNYTLALSPEVIDVESPPKKKIHKKKKKKVEVRTEEPTDTDDHSSDESVVLIDSDKQNERGDSQLGVGLGQEIIKSFENLSTNFSDLTEKFRQFIEKK